MKENKKLKAGASAINITPKVSLHLAGYPFVERFSIGTHDPLLSTALFLSDGQTSTLFISNDLIFVSKASANRVRQSISSITGIPSSNILISATHTHSGPSTVTFTAGSTDTLLPEVDKDYVQYMEDAMITNACQAFENIQNAEIGLATADATGIGTNRLDPSDASDLEVPVFLIRNQQSKEPIACMLIVCMHPTVLHEDSKLYSGDFPGIARQIIQRKIFQNECPVLYHMGPAGNQSPRHVTKENTFEEAIRIAKILVEAVDKIINRIEFISETAVRCTNKFVDLPKKKFPDLIQAEKHLNRAALKLEELKNLPVDKRTIRTAEVNWFGAIEFLHLVKMSQEGELEKVYQSCLPAEIQVIQVGPWTFIGWPGEIFVEYGLAVKNEKQNTFIISLANGELQGYIVTKLAAERGSYEASNATFDHTSGDVLVKETLHLLNNIP